MTAKQKKENPQLADPMITTEDRYYEFDLADTYAGLASFLQNLSLKYSNAAPAMTPSSVRPVTMPPL